MAFKGFRLQREYALSGGFLTRVQKHRVVDGVKEGARLHDLCVGVAPLPRHGLLSRKS